MPGTGRESLKHPSRLSETSKSCEVSQKDGGSMEICTSEFILALAALPWAEELCRLEADQLQTFSLCTGTYP